MPVPAVDPEPPHPSRPWRVPGLLKISLGLHLAGLVGLLGRPATWPLVAAVLVADHATLALSGLLPRCRLLGPNLTRLPAATTGEPELALTFDDGPDPTVTPAVLDLLARANARATFFCIGHHAEAHPGLVRELVAHGHRVENHSYRHTNAFSFLPPRPMARELDRTQHLLYDLTGRWPRYFRAPAGIRNPWLEPLLARHGLHLASWTRRAFDTVDRRPARAAARLLDGLRAGDILLLHDGDPARDRTGRPVVLELLERALDAADRRGLRPVLLPQPEDGAAV
jgi:peptidoglycan/xylan/chitin deacetylase (PgdA/CDA1 family)